MSDLLGIERLTKTFADAAAALNDAVAELETELEAKKRERMKGIKALVVRTAEAKAKLKAGVEAHPELFERPKTLTIAGVRVGFQKGKGKLDWEDDDQLVARIEKMFEKQASDYLLITKKPSSTALNELETAELRRLGVTVEDTGDQVLIKHVSSEIEKVIKAMLKEKVKEATEAA